MELPFTAGACYGSFFSFAFLSCLSVPALLSYIAPLALPDVSGSL